MVPSASVPPFSGADMQHLTFDLYPSSSVLHCSRSHTFLVYFKAAALKRLLFLYYFKVNSAYSAGVYHLILYYIAFCDPVSAVLQHFFQFHLRNHQRAVENHCFKKHFKAKIS